MSRTCAQRSLVSRILIPSSKATDWRPLLASPNTQWQKRYSARAAALSWTAAKGLPPEIAGLFPEGAELLFAAPEWKTPLPGGRRESQTDIFCLLGLADGLAAVAVEAKVDEPFGPTLSEWLVDASPGKLERLAAIQALIGATEPFDGAIRYQLLHRTASALIQARRFRATEAAMIVQSFSDERRWIDDFRLFVSALGGTAQPGQPIIVTAGDGVRLRLGWAQGDTRFSKQEYGPGTDWELAGKR